jgi:hypothetical protein
VVLLLLSSQSKSKVKKKSKKEAHTAPCSPRAHHRALLIMHASCAPAARSPCSPPRPASHAHVLPAHRARPPQPAPALLAPHVRPPKPVAASPHTRTHLSLWQPRSTPARPPRRARAPSSACGRLAPRERTRA